MKYWITFIGSSPFAVINTIWAACKQDNFVPDHLVFLINKDLERRHVDTVFRWVPRLLEEYGVKEPVIKKREIEETHFNEIRDVYSTCIPYFKQDGHVAVDITPGRKYMSAIAMYTGMAEGAEHVYYLHLKDNRYQNLPYPVIPFWKHNLIDMNKEFDVAGNNTEVIQ